MHNPSEGHFQLLKRLLCHICGTITFGFPISSGPLSFSAYSDSYWALDFVDHRSTTGYYIFLRQTLVSWATKKQPTVARSSIETEYRALATCTTEIIWLRRLLHDFHIPIFDPIHILCDN